MRNPLSASAAQISWMRDFNMTTWCYGNGGIGNMGHNICGKLQICQEYVFVAGRKWSTEIDHPQYGKIKANH